MREGDFGERPPRSGDAAAGRAPAPASGGPAATAGAGLWWGQAARPPRAPRIPPLPVCPVLPTRLKSARVLPKHPSPSSSSLGAVQPPLLAHLGPFLARTLKLGSWWRWELL